MIVPRTSRAYYPRCGVILDVLLEDFAGGISSTTYTIEAIPRRVEIRRNGHREADTVRVELDYQDLPLDPRTLRAVRIRVLLGDTRDPLTELTADVLRFQAFIGFADVPETMLSESSETVTLEGRDYTGQWLDQGWDGTAIDISGPLSDVVLDVASHVAGMDGITIEYSEGASAVILATILGKTKFTPEHGDDCWTVLVDLCGRAGLIPLFNSDTLQILSASDFTTAPSPDVGIVPQFGGRRPAFLYGQNVSRLTFRRRFNERRTKQIEVRCWDAQKRLYTAAKYPPAPIVLSKKISAEGKVTDQDAPLLPYYVQGTYDLATLTSMAQRIYEEAAREQIEGEIETAEMVDLDGMTDLPLVGNGDGVVVTLDTPVVRAIDGMSDAEAVAWLSLPPRSIDPAVATALVAARATAGKLASTFYVQTATHEWSRDEGYKLSLKFINYV